MRWLHASAIVSSDRTLPELRPGTRRRSGDSISVLRYLHHVLSLLRPTHRVVLAYLGLIPEFPPGRSSRVPRR